jgi:hypothetical protein
MTEQRSSRLLRDRVLLDVEMRLRAGNTVLVWGPWGIGKSTWLAGLYERSVSEGVPCGLAPRTTSLHDVTEALARAYPGVSLTNRSQRQVRSALRMALEARPGILLLDDLREAGTAMRGFLRSLRGTGLGIAIAVDVEHPRDLARARRLGLAYHQRAIPPLRGEPLGALVARAWEPTIHPSDRRALIRIASGRPGWVVRIAERLRDDAYWRGCRICCEKLSADVTLDALAHYVGTTRLNSPREPQRSTQGPRGVIGDDRSPII